MKTSSNVLRSWVRWTPLERHGSRAVGIGTRKWMVTISRNLDEIHPCGILILPAKSQNRRVVHVQWAFRCQETQKTVQKQSVPNGVVAGSLRRLTSETFKIYNGTDSWDALFKHSVTNWTASHGALARLGYLTQVLGHWAVATESNRWKLSSSPAPARTALDLSPEMLLVPPTRWMHTVLSCTLLVVHVMDSRPADVKVMAASSGGIAAGESINNGSQKEIPAERTKLRGQRRSRR